MPMNDKRKAKPSEKTAIAKKAAGSDPRLPDYLQKEYEKVPAPHITEFPDLVDIMPDLAEVSVGKGTAIDDLVNVMGSATRGFNLEDADKKRKFLDLLIATSERGSVEAGAMAREFGPMIPRVSCPEVGFVIAAAIMAPIREDLPVFGCE